MRVALVHDYLNQYGGAERVLEELHALWPDAPVYTSMYWPEKMSPAINAMDVRTTFMQRLPGVTRHHQPYLPVYPFAWESVDLSHYDLVISNCSSFCKGVHTGPGTVHVCYCLSPMRFVWRFEDYRRRERFGMAVRTVLPPVLRWLKAWDLRSNRGVDRFVAISSTIQDRISRYYGRESTIVYPPVETDAFEPQPDRVEDYFLIVGRMVPYKRMDLAVDACTRLGLPLKIAGSAGRDEPALRARAGRTVEFLGRVSDERRRELMARCKAFLFPGEEDFGIAPLEASASGRPVVAYAAGGPLDTVVDGVTGVLFPEQTVDSLAAALRRVDEIAWDAGAIRRHAERFDTRSFRAELVRVVEETMSRARKGAAA